MANKFTGRIVLGLDARGSKVSTSGWLKDTQLKLRDFAIKAAVLPLAAIIYTDISKDGMMAGPNLERTKALAESVDVDIVAAGGVTAVEDVRKLKDMGIAGAIIGRAIYEGKIDLSQAIEAAK